MGGILLTIIKSILPNEESGMGMKVEGEVKRRLRPDPKRNGIGVVVVALFAKVLVNGK